MGDLYRLSCEKCDSAGAAEISFEGFVGGVITGTEQGGRIVTGSYLAFLDENDEFVILPHPLESSRLAALNVTWTQASFRGRLFLVVNMICRECGAITGSPRIHHSISAGCLLGLSVLLVSYLLLWWYQIKFALFISMAILFAFLVCADWTISRWLKSRYRARVLKLSKRCCDQCGSLEIDFIGKCRGERLICPQCGERSLKVEFGGIS